MNGIIITAIICVTLVVLAGIWDQAKDKLLKEQSALLAKYKGLVDGLMACVGANVQRNPERPTAAVEGKEMAWKKRRSVCSSSVSLLS